MSFSNTGGGKRAEAFDKTDISTAAPRKRIKNENERAEEKTPCHGGATLLDFPAEIIDHIAQFLPRNSFLALRATCTDLQQKTDYHFSRRHLKEKHVVLKFNRSRAGLLALVELASNASFANCVQKVVIGMDCGYYPYAVHRITPHSYRYNTGKLGWPAYFLDPPLEQSRSDGGVAVAMSVLFASLAALPSLEVLEFVDAPDNAEGTLLPAQDILHSQRAKPFVDLSWCNRCKKPSVFGQCVHKTMLCKAVAHMTEFRVDLPDHTHALGLSSLLPDIKATWPGEHGRRLELDLLREIHFSGEHDSLYQYDRYYWSLWQDLFNYSPQLEHLNLNGSMIPSSRLWDQCWSSVNLPSGLLTSLSLHGLNISSNKLAALFQQNGASLHHVSLDGVMLTRTTFPYQFPPIDVFLNVLAQYAEKLKYIFIRAIFHKNRPYLFGDETSSERLQAYLSHESKRVRDENFSIWRFSGPNAQATSNSRDLTGWKFEGEEVEAGLVFLRDNARLAPDNWL
ncbi:hypothetical protein BU16DRAFT_532548 [Lophium mytilinum]|uniref:F-box domain-containing protein n=1 Tax=Lophium mytilinum TaxID=390894 RepID=A0A6A6REJ0_9PEZI|nr:hypothetical protein BU16DRAFT_532548 [Lophium mytilinum]